MKQSQTPRLRRTANTTLHVANREYDDQNLICDRPPPIDPDDNQWEVEKLVSKRRIGTKLLYLVKWKGYPAGESSWQEKVDIHPELVKDYEARHRRRRHSHLKPRAYPHGILPGRPISPGIYITRFGRSSYPTWKISDTLTAARRAGRADGIRVKNRNLRRRAH